MGQGHVDLSQVETFILDEADRMLDMGFIPDIQVIARLPEDRRNGFFCDRAQGGRGVGRRFW